MTNVSARGQRLIAISLLAIVVALAMSAVVIPTFNAINDAADDHQRSLRLLGKFNGLAASEPQLRSAIAKIDAHPLWQRFYQGVDPATAAAQVQGEVRSLVDAQGVPMTGIQPLDPVVVGDVVRITLRVSFTTTIDKLSRLALAMESGPHLLQFENLSVIAPLDQNGEGNPPLVAHGDIVAYLLKAAP